LPFFLLSRILVSLEQYMEELRTWQVRSSFPAPQNRKKKSIFCPKTSELPSFPLDSGGTIPPEKARQALWPLSGSAKNRPKTARNYAWPCLHLWQLHFAEGLLTRTSLLVSPQN
jgi:hypothetical protein